MHRSENRPDLTRARRVLRDVGWLSMHHDHAQAARRLAEVLQIVEQHLVEIRESLDSAQVARRSPAPRQPLEIDREHRRLMHLVEQAQMFNSRSDPVRCNACLRRLTQSLERHERRDAELLSRFTPSHQKRTTSEEADDDPDSKH